MKNQIQVSEVLEIVSDIAGTTAVLVQIGEDREAVKTNLENIQKAVTDILYEMNVTIIDNEA